MDNTARKIIIEAINNGKHVVTANKSLLAKEGSIFEELAKEKGVFLRYEAAVAGGHTYNKSVTRLSHSK